MTHEAIKLDSVARQPIVGQGLLCQSQLTRPRALEHMSRLGGQPHAEPPVHHLVSCYMCVLQNFALQSTLFYFKLSYLCKDTLIPF